MDSMIGLAAKPCSIRRSASPGNAIPEKPREKWFGKRLPFSCTEDDSCTTVSVSCYTTPQVPLHLPVFQGGNVALNHPSEQTHSRIGLLIVDDERAIAEMLEIGLEPQGFTIWSATNAQEALNVFRQHAAAIQLALLDVQMPGL